MMMRKVLWMAACLSVIPQSQAVLVSEPISFARSADEVSALIDDCLQAMNAVLEVYEGVADTRSADAAAERLKPLHLRMQQTVDKVNSLGEVDAATQNLLMTRLLPMIIVNASRTETAFDRIRQNAYYGSEALRHFMEVELRPAGQEA